MSEILEILMVVSFGVSWPFNVWKAYKARTAKATSLGFLVLIFVGYIFGIVSKLVSGNFKMYVLVFYFINLFMLALALLVYFRNRFLDKLREKGIVK